ncbi:MAG TPA: type II toxin-antitoxin system VapC family toxin [Nitrososphaerales archaeon]|nr:type II toxin-antitoxin system VapC family toxin [Nitrososphaerales archaeon]
MPTILIIDTNIWAYFFDRDAAEHRRVEGPVENALKTEQIAANTIVVMELAQFLVRSLGPVSGGEKLGLFLRFPLAISDFEYQDALEAVDMLKRYSHLGICGRDATILALMRRAKVNRIMTHDAALKRVDWLEVIDPLQAA